MKAHLQLRSDPPVEDGEVRVLRKHHSGQVHFLFPSCDGHHLQMDFL